MAIPTLLKQVKDSVNRCKEVFGNIIEYEKAEIKTDEKMFIHSLNWRDFRPRKIKNDYIAEFKYVRDEQQYTFRLRDPKTDEISFIVMIYHFSTAGELLENSQLYYYPPMGFRGYTTEELFDASTDDNTCSLLMDVEGAFDLKFDIENTSHLRIDYSKKYCRQILHPLVHLHFGAINDLRLAITKFPSPFMFTSFIVQNFFRDEWEKIFFSAGVFLKAKYLAEVSKVELILPDSSAEEESFFLHHK